MYSLKKKITRNLVINMVVVMSGLLIIMYFSMARLFEDYMITRLQHDAESIISVIERSNDGSWQVDPTRLSSVYNRVRSGHYYQVRVNQQILSSRSLFDSEFPLGNSGDNLSGSFIADGSGDEVLLVWHQQATRENTNMKILVAEDIEPVRLQLLTYTAYAIAPVLLVTLLLIYMQHRILNKAFNVFEVLRQNLSFIRQRETGKAGVHVPQEIQPLVGEIETLVEKLSNRIKRTRHAIGNLAHELKQPLQILSLQQRDRADAETLKPLQSIQTIIDRELRRAKISGSRGVGGEFFIDEELPYLIDVLGRIYPEISIDTDISSIAAGKELDRDDMLELLGNLLDNACKFATGQVKISFRENQHILLMTIEDDGAGIADDEMEKISDRGYRLDESKAGHGLGLSICSDIVEGYHGSLEFSHSQMGGLKVAVEIPL